ncbi:MAG: hypothetical protein U1E23_09630 [Reyranellaceae bacterium]
MWTAIIGALGAIIPAVLKLFGGGKDKSADDYRELGRVEQQNADMKDEMAVVHAATVAAKQAETSNAPDPNDLDARG